MQYVVIFKALIRTLDELYFSTAQQLRDKALTHFNCQHFEALTEGEHEIALSYWNTLEDIRAWQQDAQHLVAQQLGKNQWYASFSVEICKVLRRYHN
ncbi:MULTISPECIES: antibiotic biosynthesis monooxygenase [unclassified Acinetobacter]|uniref:antibiotic biosynthesis monooxygenase family protein n=1 Tax=unclassified Acinetobacter TaxID=196816 RepID=UPI0015D3505D|nr:MULTISPECIES: antibiotic biosynthesis monooxygenase [unclassified Acinetobacter]QOW50684.1 antibiotic biosynthesis monooxygenase [Acinetobacter sp. YH12138]